MIYRFEATLTPDKGQRIILVAAIEAGSPAEAAASAAQFCAEAAMELATPEQIAALVSNYLPQPQTVYTN